ncbi:the ARF-like 2 binding protein BART-domain-containing protein [Zopfochytrium polystomum]|nr:the ARF-like 2 binding protein BART-domain-containing protein [Zopfochytrium polystomum]
MAAAASPSEYGNHHSTPSSSASLIDLFPTDEELWADRPTDPEDQKFDEIVGTLEELLMDDDFVAQQRTFMEKHCHHFSDDDENKLVYMDVFREYTDGVERFLERKLTASLPWFSMADFMGMLESRADADPTAAEGDVFEMLASLGDFGAFKDMMLSFKHERDGTNIDLSGLIAVKASR